MADPIVECYSGYTYAQAPRAFAWQERRFEVAKIEEQWRTPHGYSFAVRTRTEERFELHYDELQDRWMIHPLPVHDRKSAEKAKVLAFPFCKDRENTPD
jgi:hypothetical protein